MNYSLSLSGIRHLFSISIVVFFLLTLNAYASTVEENKEAARQWYEEVIVKKNLAVLDKILAKDVTIEYAPGFMLPNNTNKLGGIDTVKSYLEDLNKRGTFSGKIIYLIGEDNVVALYRMVTEKMNGNIAVVPWATFFEFNDDGKIAKIYHVNDTLYESEHLKGGSADKSKIKM